MRRCCPYFKHGYLLLETIPLIGQETNVCERQGRCTQINDLIKVKWGSRRVTGRANQLDHMVKVFPILLPEGKVMGPWFFFLFFFLSSPKPAAK